MSGVMIEVGPAKQSAVGRSSAVRVDRSKLHGAQRNSAHADVFDGTPATVRKPFFERQGAAMKQKPPQAITEEDAPMPPRAPPPPVQRADPIRGFALIDDTPFARNVRQVFQRIINPRPKTVVHNQPGMREFPVKAMDGDPWSQTLPDPRNPGDSHLPSQRGVGLGAGPGNAPNTWFDNLAERIFGARGFDPQRNRAVGWGDTPGGTLNAGGPVPPLNPSGPPKRKIVADAPPPVSFGSTPIHPTWNAMPQPGKDASTAWANKQHAASARIDAWSDRFVDAWAPEADKSLEARRAPRGAGQEVPPLAAMLTGNVNGVPQEGKRDGHRQRDVDHSVAARGLDARPHGMMDTEPHAASDRTALSQRNTEPMELAVASFSSMPTGMSNIPIDGDDTHMFAHKVVPGPTFTSTGGIGAVPPDPLARQPNPRNLASEQPRAESLEMRTTIGRVGNSFANNRNTWGAARVPRRAKDEDADFDKDHTRMKWELDKAHNKRQRSRSF